jgi:hypothetical protein
MGNLKVKKESSSRVEAGAEVEFLRKELVQEKNAVKTLEKMLEQKVDETDRLRK